MSQEGRFPVLVEVDGPGGEGLGKQLCMYFNHRRKSGGEDCQVVQLGSNIFKVSFLHGQVQQRVLQRKEHVITRDSVERKLTVRSLEDGDEFSAEHQTLEARDTSGNLSAGNWPSLGAMPKGRRSLKNSAASMESGRSADSGEPGKRVAVDPAFRKRLDQREDVLRDLQQELLRARCKIRLDDAADSILLVPASRGASGEVAAGWGEGAERAFRRFQERVLGEDETGDRPQAGGETRAVARLEHPSRFSVIWPPFKEQLASCFPGLKWALDESRTSITFSGRPTFVRDAMSNLSTQMDQVLEQPIRLSDKKRAFLASWAPGELAKELFSFPVALELADDRATLLCSSWPELNRAKSILTSRIVQEEVDVQGDAQDWLQSRSPFPDELTNKVQVVEVRDKRG
ncbi:uncharacterized protein [Scyliorhinus torazame]|uniref:uncharacterized protein n=1 Tax=Scyliorhinus torazame TaxID=75743 RepID=UPI003B5BCA15